MTNRTQTMANHEQGWHGWNDQPRIARIIGQRRISRDGLKRKARKRGGTTSADLQRKAGPGCI
ncbi:MAG: hypothetical protein IPL64_01020 [Flavobacteriales bacterium]|nr:hypothetical protein [Flavobacteriales bacterium]